MKKLPLIALLCLLAPAAAAETILCKGASPGKQDDCPVPLSVSKIPDLDAAKLVSGNVSLARIAVALATGGGPIKGTVVTATTRTETPTVGTDSANQHGFPAGTGTLIDDTSTRLPSSANTTFLSTLAGLSNGYAVINSSGVPVARNFLGDFTYILVTNGSGDLGNTSISLISGSVPFYTVTAGANAGFNVGGRCFMKAPGAACSSTTEEILMVSSRASSVARIRCFVGTAPGVGQTATFVPRTATGASALSDFGSSNQCVISGTNTNCSNNIGGLAQAIDTKFSIALDLSAGAVSPGTAHCSLNMTN